MTNENISGSLVNLKPVNLKDQEQINQWNQDIEVTRYREVYKSGDEKLSGLCFGIYDQKSQKLIGDIGINSIDQKNKHAEIGMAIGDKNYWSKGYGTDVVKTILRFCFEDLNLNKVYLDVWGGK